MNIDLLFKLANELTIKESWECLLMAVIFNIMLMIDGICYYFKEQ